jgi:hypothetical protein
VNFLLSLSKHSILSGSIQQQESDMDSGYFEKGIMDGSEMNLLNAVFRVRVNHLFKQSDCC